MSDFKHTTPICPHCGAAYTPHTPECPKYGYPPPALAPKGPVSIETRATFAGGAPPTPLSMDLLRKTMQELKRDR